MSGSSERSGHTAAVRAAHGGRAIPLAHPGAIAAGGGRGCGDGRRVAGRVGHRSAPGARRGRTRARRGRCAGDHDGPFVRSRSSAASPCPEDRALARYIEEQCPELEDRLATAVEIVAGSSRCTCGHPRGDAGRCLACPRPGVAGGHRAARAGAARRPARSRRRRGAGGCRRALGRARPAGAAVRRALCGARTPGAACISWPRTYQAGRPVRDSCGNDGGGRRHRTRRSRSQSAISAARSACRPPAGIDSRGGSRVFPLPSRTRCRLRGALRRRTPSRRSTRPASPASICGTSFPSTRGSLPATRRTAATSTRRTARASRCRSRRARGRPPAPCRSPAEPVCRCSRRRTAASRRRCPSPPTAHIAWL